MANALSNSQYRSIDSTLQEVLATCLDAAGVSKGALFIVNNNSQLSLQHYIGFDDDVGKQVLDEFFRKYKLLKEVMTNKEVILIPSPETSQELLNEMQTKLDIASALLVPLVSGSECYGVMLMGSMNTVVTGSDPVIFARAIGGQVGLTIQLANAFEQIHSSEQRYRVLMDNASCGLLTHDENGVINEINKMGETIFGTSRDKIVGQNITSFLPVEQYEHIKNIFLNSASESVSASNEIKINLASGETCSVALSVASVDVENKRQSLVILNDVSKRNKLRSQAFLSDKLNTVGTLAAGIAHEINNPIAWVLANLGYLKMNMNLITSFQNDLYNLFQEPDKDRQLAMLEKLIADPKQQSLSMKFNEIVDETLIGAERVRDIVRNLKSFARVDQTEMAPADLHQVINTAISMAVPEFKYRSRMEKNFAPNMPLVMMNSSKMHQVFLNLILNAAQAIPDGDVENNKIQITTQLEDGKIRVDVSDTGKGIPPEILPRIFDPFFTTKPVGVGSGLGLSICYDMVRSLGGTIKVKSIVNKGTTFSVYLPYQSEKSIPKKQIPIIESLENVHQRKKILVIDDEPALLKSMGRMLEENHDVVTALGGKAALGIIEKTEDNFDAIVCDLSMPDVSGADVYNFIAQKRPGMEKRVIFVTGGIYLPALVEFFATVTNTRLEKPFAYKDLLDAIDKIVK